MIISASQLQNFELCPRKWWAGYVRKLPRLERDAFDFGTALHAVCERYLLADDLGRDPNTGKAVDLYPSGWGDGITPREQSTIKQLIDEAITEGVLERKPCREIEYKFLVPVIPGVQITGFIDVMYPDSVEDHKTSKSPRWFVSRDKMPNNLQLLIYAKIVLDRDPSLERVLLRHNQYCKDPENLQVRKTEAFVTREQIEEAWEDRVVSAAHKMLEMKATEYDKWFDTPEPDYTQRPCQAYGGCEFSAICGKRETEDLYRKRIDRANKVRHNTSNGISNAEVTITAPPRALTKENGMGLEKLLDRKKQMAAGNPPASVNPPAAEPEATEPEAVEVPQLPEGMDWAPWVNPEDRVAQINDGLGFKADGSPCRVSAMRGKKYGLPQPDEFVCEVTGDGTVAWICIEDDSISGVTPLSLTAKPVKAVSMEAKPVKEKEPEPEPEQVEVVEPVEQKEAVEVGDKLKIKGSKGDAVGTAVADQETDDLVSEVTKSTKRGRKPTRFTLLINCVPLSRDNAEVSDGSTYMLLDDLLYKIIEKIEDDNPGTGFYELNAFARRDTIAGMAPQICENLNSEKNLVIYCMGVGTGASEQRVLLDAIKPFAGFVVQGVLG